jgi:hypothetical protein
MELMMSTQSRRELFDSIRPQCQKANRKEKQTLLTGLLTATGLSRKHAIAILNKVPSAPAIRQREKKYDDAVAEALRTVWLAANKICSKRLIPFLPEFLKSLEAFGHIDLEDDVRFKLLSVSPATADRILKAERAKLGKSKGLTKPGHLIKKQIDVRTFADWKELRPGFFEADLVAHGGTRADGQFLQTLTLTDIETGWTELGALLRRSEADVINSLNEMRSLIPFPFLGIDTDNGSEFINYELIDWCQKNEISFTRSREYKKNDQAHVEEKNGSIVRRLVGYERYEGSASRDLLAKLYKIARLYINYFQPCLKLVSKERLGGRVRKKYSKAQTPYRRVSNSDSIPENVKLSLIQNYQQLDPVALLNQLEIHQRNFQRSNSATSDQPLLSLSITMLTENEYRSMRIKELQPVSDVPVTADIIPALSKAPSSRDSVVHKKPGRKSSLDLVEDDINTELALDPTLTGRRLLSILMKKYPGRFRGTQRSSLHGRILAWRMDQLQVPSRKQNKVKAPIAKEPDWQELKRMLKEQTTTRMLFWRKYKVECESQSLRFYGYSQFCRNFSAWLEQNSKNIIEPDWQKILHQTLNGKSRIELWRTYSQSCALSDHFYYSYNNFCRTLALWQSKSSNSISTASNTAVI